MVPFLSWPYLKANLMSFSRIQFDIISCVLHYWFIECDMLCSDLS